jgi:hypothetical protein
MILIGRESILRNVVSIEFRSLYNSKILFILEKIPWGEPK